MSAKYTPISAVSGGRKNLKMCVRVAHIWLIRERKVPTSIIFMNMLLVAISQVTSRGGLKILINDEDGDDTNVASNVVYREVFRNVYNFFVYDSFSYLLKLFACQRTSVSLLKLYVMLK